MSPTLQLLGIAVSFVASVIGGVWKLASSIKESKAEIIEKIAELERSVTKEVHELDTRVTVIEYARKRRVNGHIAEDIQ